MTALAHRVVRQHGFLLAPISSELHIAPVITRSVLAAAMGGALVFVATLATNGLPLVTNGLMGQIRIPADAGEQFLQALGTSAATAGAVPDRCTARDPDGILAPDVARTASVRAGNRQHCRHGMNPPPSV
jgi:hypothetical protein